MEDTVVSVNGVLKNNQSHTIWVCLTSVPAKLEAVSYENNKSEDNVRQMFIPYALSHYM